MATAGRAFSWPPGSGLLDAVRLAVARHGLLARGERVVVAVSGGADSVALLHALVLLRAELELTLGIVHVHHGLRAEADRDAALVERLGLRFDCPVLVERVVVPSGEGRSPEEAARLVRHAALARAARAFGATRVALGHTADDQAETVLMRVFQGAGPRGLAGMPVRRGMVIRPLLDVRRAAVLAHLGAHGLEWVEDATNRDPKFLRNRIRHEILPWLGAGGVPRIQEALSRTATASREVVEALDALLAPRLERLVEPWPGAWRLDLRMFEGLAPGAVKALLGRSVMGWAAPESLGSGLRAHHLRALHALTTASAGTRVRLPRGLVAERGRDAIWLVAPVRAAESMALAVPGAATLEAAGLEVEACRTLPGTGAPPDAPWEAWFDLDRMPPDLVVRPSRPGDRMVPFGSCEAVRVRRLQAAAGLPRALRGRWPVLAGGPRAESVLWLIGVRRSAVAPVGTETEAVLRVRARVGSRPRFREEGS
jgi:tRNA(Ile)-lysidine synthase